MNRILDPIRVEHIDGRQWKLLETFRYYLDDPRGPEWVEVPAGFITDFASVPRFFHRLFLPTGRYSAAALVHDQLYAAPIIRSIVSVRTCHRDEADAIFLDAMQTTGVGWWTRTTLYVAVRVGGERVWNEYRKGDYAPA